MTPRRINIYDTSPIAVQPIRKAYYKTEWHKSVFCQMVKNNSPDAMLMLGDLQRLETILLKQGDKLDITV